MVGPTLKVVSWNVKGLRIPNKRRHLKQFNVDIALLQETHLSSQDFFRMHQSWVGHVMGAAVNNRSAGVLMLMRKNLPCTILTQDHDNSTGRWSHVSIRVGNSVLELWNVYGPNVDNKPLLDLLASRLSTIPSSSFDWRRLQCCAVSFGRPLRNPAI